jgi:hypothetical protein
MGISNIDDKRGLVPLTNLTADVGHIGILQCYVPAGRAATLAVGDLVKFTGTSVGQIPLDGAAGTTDPQLVNAGAYPSIDLWDTGDVAGVVVGFEYDPERGKAGQKYLKTTDAAVALVKLDPNAEYLAYASAAIAVTDSGKNVGITARSLNTTYGTPGFKLNAASVATTNTLPIRLIRPAGLPGNDITLANAAWIVRINTPALYGRTGV